jgi:hypothetical protein
LFFVVVFSESAGRKSFREKGILGQENTIFYRQINRFFIDFDRSH